MQNVFLCMESTESTEFWFEYRQSCIGDIDPNFMISLVLIFMPKFFAVCIIEYPLKIKIDFGYNIAMIHWFGFNFEMLYIRN